MSNLFNRDPSEQNAYAEERATTHAQKLLGKAQEKSEVFNVMSQLAQGLANGSDSEGKSLFENLAHATGIGPAYATFAEASRKLRSAYHTGQVLHTYRQLAKNPLNPELQAKAREHLGNLVESVMHDQVPAKFRDMAQGVTDAIKSKVNPTYLKYGTHMANIAFAKTDQEREQAVNNMLDDAQKDLRRNVVLPKEVQKYADYARQLQPYGQYADQVRQYANATPEERERILQEMQDRVAQHVKDNVPVPEVVKQFASSAESANAHLEYGMHVKDAVLAPNKFEQEGRVLNLRRRIAQDDAAKRVVPEFARTYAANPEYYSPDNVRKQLEDITGKSPYRSTAGHLLNAALGKVDPIYGKYAGHLGDIASANTPEEREAAIHRMRTDVESDVAKKVKVPAAVQKINDFAKKMEPYGQYADLARQYANADDATRAKIADEIKTRVAQHIQDKVPVPAVIKNFAEHADQVQNHLEYGEHLRNVLLASNQQEHDAAVQQLQQKVEADKAQGRSVPGPIEEYAQNPERYSYENLRGELITRGTAALDNIAKQQVMKGSLGQAIVASVEGRHEDALDHAEKALYGHLPPSARPYVQTAVQQLRDPTDPEEFLNRAKLRFTGQLEDAKQRFNRVKDNVVDYGNRVVGGARQTARGFTDAAADLGGRISGTVSEAADTVGHIVRGTNLPEDTASGGPPPAPPPPQPEETNSSFKPKRKPPPPPERPQQGQELQSVADQSKNEEDARAELDDAPEPKDIENEDHDLVGFGDGDLKKGGYKVMSKSFAEQAAVIAKARQIRGAPPPTRTGFNETRLDDGPGPVGEYKRGGLVIPSSRGDVTGASFSGDTARGGPQQTASATTAATASTFVSSTLQPEQAPTPKTPGNNPFGAISTAAGVGSQPVAELAEKGINKVRQQASEAKPVSNVDLPKAAPKAASKVAPKPASEATATVSADTSQARPATNAPIPGVNRLPDKPFAYQIAQRPPDLPDQPTAAQLPKEPPKPAAEPPKPAAEPPKPAAEPPKPAGPPRKPSSTPAASEAKAEPDFENQTAVGAKGNSKFVVGRKNGDLYSQYVSGDANDEGLTANEGFFVNAKLRKFGVKVDPTIGKAYRADEQIPRFPPREVTVDDPKVIGAVHHFGQNEQGTYHATEGGGDLKNFSTDDIHVLNQKLTSGGVRNINSVSRDFSTKDVISEKIASPSSTTSTDTATGPTSTTSSSAGTSTISANAGNNVDTNLNKPTSAPTSSISDSNSSGVQGINQDDSAANEADNAATKQAAKTAGNEAASASEDAGRVAGKEESAVNDVGKALNTAGDADAEVEDVATGNVLGAALAGGAAAATWFGGKAAQTKPTPPPPPVDTANQVNTTTAVQDTSAQGSALNAI